MAAPQALTPEQIQQIIAAGRGNTVNLNGTIYQGNYADTGSGETFQEGALQDIYGYTPEQNKVGGTYNQYDPTGAFSRTGTQQEVNATEDFIKFLAGAGLTFALPGALSGSLFGGAGAAANAGTTFAGEALADAGLLAGGGAAAGAAASGLTAAQIANLARAGISVAGLLGAGNAVSNMGGGNTSTTATPITYSGGGAGGYSPEYFSQLQSNYNSLMPNVPRDVASPLQNWYSTEFNPGASITGSLFGGMTGGMTPTTLKPVTPPVVKPPVVPPVVRPPTTIVGGGGTDTVVGGGVTDTVVGGGVTDTVVNPGSAGYQYATTQLGLTPAQYLNNINQWIIDNPRASRSQIDAVMAQAGVSQTDLQEALRTTTFSDATKYALTHGGSLQELGNTIVEYINSNPTATNAQIQEQQTQYGISDQDIANALYGLNSSAGKEYAVVQDIGLNQYYQNIADAAQSGISASEAAAQMQQYGVSPADVAQAYSLFAPSGGLTLNDVLAAYNK
jgi:hypothetical protein